MNIPANNQSVMPYLVVKNAPAFIEFTQKIFGAIETLKVMRDETTVMHAEIMIGDSTIMVADSTEVYTESPAGLFVYVEDADETFTKAIDEGATVVTGLSDQPYGRSGGIKDQFGNTWWITSVK